MSLEQPGEAEEEGAPLPLPDIAAPVVPRIATGMAAFDDLLGGGLVPGSSLLLTGPPGAGKSTFLLQLLDSSGQKAFYITGEESIQQLKFRADRLCINSRAIAVMFETNVTRVAAHVRMDPPKILVIDSIQTMYSDLSDSLPGTPPQIRKCTYVLRRLAQKESMILLIVGQVTKGLQAAGPKMLEHAVDAVLSLELCEEKTAHRRLSVVKNRFGPAGSAISLALTGGGFPVRKA